MPGRWEAAWPGRGPRGPCPAPALALIGDGLTNREIGKRPYLSEKTVKNHISRLLAKRGVQRRVQAAVLASHLDQPGAGDHAAH